MLNIDLTINLLALLSIVLTAGLIGYAFRSRQIKKKQWKIQELRKEVVYNHAYILELQKEYVALESRTKATKTPVLSMNLPKDYIEEDKKVSEGFM